MTQLRPKVSHQSESSVENEHHIPFAGSFKNTKKHLQKKTMLTKLTSC